MISHLTDRSLIARSLMYLIKCFPGEVQLSKVNEVGGVGRVGGGGVGGVERVEGVDPVIV